MEIKIKRIGMWACPRRLSTAMMRSWGNRPDTFVRDEPFYPHYLFYYVVVGKTQGWMKSSTTMKQIGERS